MGAPKAHPSYRVCDPSGEHVPSYSKGKTWRECTVKCSCGWSYGPNIKSHCTPEHKRHIERCARLTSYTDEELAHEVKARTADPTAESPLTAVKAALGDPLTEHDPCPWCGSTTCRHSKCT